MRRLAREHEVLVTVEEGAIGGFASHVLHFLAHEGLLDSGLKVRPLVLPDVFIDQAKPEKMYADAGLDAPASSAPSLPRSATRRAPRCLSRLEVTLGFSLHRNPLFTLIFGGFLTLSLGRFLAPPC